MSRLQLFCPSEDADRVVPPRTHSRLAAAPAVIPFRSRRSLNASADPMIGALLRAQTIRKNQSCPDCGHPVVVPIELNDAGLNRNGMPIPGTATLVGFHCNACASEWPV